MRQEKGKKKIQKRNNFWLRKHKILVSFFFILLFFITFLGSAILWQMGGEHSSAESTTTEVDNQSSQKLITVNTTFYNYRYDREMYDGARDQGAQSCYDGGVIPFGTFDSALSKYYKDNNVKVGIYAGNFYNYYGGLEGVGNNKLPFPGYYYFRWAANIANRHSPYNSVCQGIVSDTLNGFDKNIVTSGTLMTATNSGGKVEMPYFKKDFLTTNKGNNVPIGAVRENVGFPFRQVTSGSKKGYYEFDSTKDVVRFKGMWINNSWDTPAQDYYYFGKKTSSDDTQNTETLGTLYYYYNKNFVYSKASTSPQFFPFNKPDTAQQNLDYGYGIRFNIPFYLSSDGKIDGKNMVFEFSGDDDVWIFLDGELVLDLGGQHGKATGTIDFGVSGNKARVTNSTVTFVNGSTNAADTVMSDKILAEDTYVSSTSKTIDGIEKGDLNKHVITVFYMERGMFESNFHMAFNFVPEGVPMPTATPEPTMPPNPNDIDSGSLTVKNKMVFPSTINSAFSDTVKNLAEDDVFQYSIKNKGTKAGNVGDSGIEYPSGKLTVRNGTVDKNKTENSYLSFGTQPKVRVYFDIGKAKELISNLSGTKSKFQFIEDGSGNIKKGHNSEKVVNSNSCSSALIKFSDSLYYADFKSTDTYFKIETDYIPFYDDGGNSEGISFHTNGTDNKVTVDDMKQHDGEVFVPTVLDGSEWGHIKITDYRWDPVNDTHPALGGGDTEYSSGLPFAQIGNASKFTPNDTLPDFQNVANTTFELREAHLAPTNSNILVNADVCSGVTSGSGVFGMFYDDSATFKKQFATGSLMKVEQKDSLMKPERHNDDLSEDANASDKLTKFVNRSDAEKRTTSDYYYTTVTASSISADQSTKETIDVSYDGKYTYANGAKIPASDPVNITQTFTNTVKTGSLTISKELNGNMDEDSAHSYGFEITFSKVFGGSSSEKTYEGSYTLIAEDGTKTTETATTGIIILKPNQKATISGIPVGTTYQIKEVNADGSAVNDGSVVNEIQTTYVAYAEEESISSPVYNATNDTAGIEVDKTNRTITGVIPCSVVDKLYGSETNEFTEVNVSVAYTNQFGALSITKKISGDVNNSTYYGTDSKGNATKEYTFIVTRETEADVYNGDYLEYTYEYENGEYKKTTITRKNTTNGKIILKEGQKAEIGGISLSSSQSFTIKEEIEDTDIFFVEDLKVTTGKKDDLQDNKTKITTTLSKDNPAFDVIYSNRYSDAYISIEKYIDKLYNEKASEKEYSKDLTYQELTNAKQSFIFKVKQYKILADAEAGNDSYEKSFDVVVSMGSITAKLSDAEKDSDESEYSYKTSKTIKVLGNRYYRIEEDTNWSWKYELNKTKITDGNPSPESKKSTADDKVVILKSYLDTINEMKDKEIPVAKFYNSIDEEKEDIEGDTDSIPNKIKKPKEDTQ